MPLKLGQRAISTILNESDEEDSCSSPSAKSAKFTVFDERSKKTFTVQEKNIPEKDRVLFASTSVRKRGDHQHQVRVIGIGENVTLRESALQVTLTKNVELLADDEPTYGQLKSATNKTATPRRKGRKKKIQATSTQLQMDEIEAEAARLAFCFPVMEPTPDACASAPTEEGSLPAEPSPHAPEKCICECTCGAKERGQSQAPSRNSKPLTPAREEDQKKTPPPSLKWLVVDASGEWFYPGAPSSAFKLPGRVFHCAMKLVMMLATKFNLIPIQSKLYDESRGNNDATTCQTKSNSRKKKIPCLKTHPFSTAMRMMFREYFTDAYIQSHSFHGISTNKSSKVGLTKQDLDFCFTIEKFFQSFKNYSGIDCAANDIDPAHNFYKLSNSLDTKQRRQKVNRKISLPSPEPLRTSPRRQPNVLQNNLSGNQETGDSLQIVTIYCPPFRKSAPHPVEQENMRRTSNPISCRKSLTNILADNKSNSVELDTTLLGV